MKTSIQFFKNVFSFANMLAVSCLLYNVTNVMMIIQVTTKAISTRGVSIKKLL